MRYIFSTTLKVDKGKTKQNKRGLIKTVYETDVHILFSTLCKNPSSAQQKNRKIFSRDSKAKIS